MREPAVPLTEAEKAALLAIQHLPPLIVFSLQDNYPSGATRVMLLEEGFVENNTYASATSFLIGLKENLRAALDKMYPHACITKDCKSVADPGQELCVNCQDAAAEEEKPTMTAKEAIFGKDTPPIAPMTPKVRDMYEDTLGEGATAGLPVAEGDST